MKRCALVFEPPDGGVAGHVARLARGLGEHGWSPTVIGPPVSNAYPALAEAGIPVRRLPFARGLRHPAGDARSLLATVRLLRAERFDLVHAHSSKAGVIARCAARAVRTPAVYTPHCFPFAMPTGRAGRMLTVGIERALGRASAAVVCVAEQERRIALEHRIAAPERLHVIHNGTDACPAAIEPDPSLAAWRGDAPLAACLTVLRPQKAVHTFLDAAPAIIARVPEARLAVVGDGDLRGELEAHAATLGLGDRVGFFAFAPPPARQLASIDVFVLPSAWEAFPLAILDAMACGVPQVATDVGGTAEAVLDGETGLLVAPGDPAALAERIAELLLDPGRRERMGEAARVRHGERFAADRMVAETARLYDDVMAAAT